MTPETNFIVIPTDEFQRDTKRLLKKYPSLKTDLADFTESLRTEPQQGEPLGKDCYKVRLLIRSKRTGKSGGGRVISLVRMTAERVYLLALYDKSEQTTLTDSEITERIEKIPELTAPAPTPILTPGDRLP